MRFNLRRVFVLCLIAFCTTLVILSFPRSEGPYVDSDIEKDPQFLQAAVPEGRHFNFDQLNTKKGPPRGRVYPNGAGEQLTFQKQPNPPSLIKNTDYGDPFDFTPPHDQQLLRRIYEAIKRIDFDELIPKECTEKTTLKQYWLQTEGKQVSADDSWERFYSHIGSCDMYRDETVIDELLRDLNKFPIKTVHIMDGGTQVKLVFTFENGKQAVFKPMRFGRDYESDINHFYFSDFERHQAEIATFHLDKILGFRRAVPTVGRIVNITSDLYDKAEKKLKKTFFVSPAKNKCFVGRCDYYCDTTHAICGLPDLKEGSLQVFLPDEGSVPRKHNRSPYRRTYSKKNQLAEWQTNMDYCTNQVKAKGVYAHGRKLLDLIDLHIMDYLIGNQDRHHYESFNVFGKIPSYAIHLDNGRAFGRTDFDDHDILLPLKQCCLIRPRTLQTLLNYYSEPRSLTRALHDSMFKDPVHPILAFKHYPALERRLHDVIKAIDGCLQKVSASAMVMNHFHNSAVAEDQAEEESKINILAWSIDGSRVKVHSKLCSIFKKNYPTLTCHIPFAFFIFPILVQMCLFPQRIVCIAKYGFTIFCH
ncbi:unnamed protein product, partial [Mesorhabditis belari]|uniref:FAM20 C-terminal domain-containing protein n=1 Tax=Mesorhabditis belari TaxID=2138241 RepID=A0AAF3ETA1_9BILA